MEGFIRVAVLYLSILTPQEMPQLFPISKYEDYDKCNTHKKHLIKNMKKSGQYTRDTLLFCSIIKIEDKHKDKFQYIDELPYCSKHLGKYRCGFIY